MDGMIFGGKAKQDYPKRGSGFRHQQSREGDDREGRQG